MTEALRIDGGELPSTTGVRAPHTRLLTSGRFVPSAIIRTWWDLGVHGADNVPRTGPVVMAANHVGWLDGPMLAICAPRPVHALTKLEMFTGAMGWGLRRSGQIPLDRFNSDPGAIKACLKVLRSGNAIGIFPEGARGAGEFERFHLGAAYLGLVTGAPIVPVVEFGTRKAGAGSSSMPPRDQPVDMVIGAPLTFEPQPWPRTHRDVVTATLRLRQHLLDHLAEAKRITGRTLPGPIPGDEVEPDPATGITDQEAS
jgi:1-acyl-sn-glycerol-3-phosphate acyltransferase